MKYPVGIQSFQQLREGGYIYVDKTELIWQLISSGKYYFLSRPRRFGKSLLISTLEAYFQGHQELFNGLKIAEYEKEWAEYPVIHLDLNAKAYDSRASLDEMLSSFISLYEGRFGVVTNHEYSVEIRFAELIRNIHTATGRTVVVLIDEYDKPLLNNVDNQPAYDEIQTLLKAFYGVLKSADNHIKFAMLTGVGRFGHVSVFSDLNNLDDISLDEAYNAICGVSESELQQYFGESIKTLAQRHHISSEEAAQELKRRYDGYRFSNPEYTEGIYNPFSLLNCFRKNDFGDYWFESGTPSFLIRMLMKQGYDFSDLNFEVEENVLKGVNVPERSIKSMLYQTGYLTIKHYDPKYRIYTIGLPNDEVKEGFYTMSFATFGDDDEKEFNFSSFVDDLREGHVDSFMQRLKSLFAKVPYEQSVNVEAAYHNVLFLLFTLFGYRTESEHHMNHGRTDLVVKTRKRVYIFEFKINKSADDALSQIEERHYDEPYKASGLEIVKIGVNFSSAERNISDWKEVRE